MIQYLHRLKAKKGFTLVELIVVLAIMAVIITILMVNMSGVLYGGAADVHPRADD